MTDGGTAAKLYYLYNGHGDVTELIDTAGTIQAQYTYDAFGVPKTATGTADNPFRYAGYEYDEETDLYYLKSRMYNPVIARFMQEDTYRGRANDPLSLNLYSYCANNPIIYTDIQIQRAMSILHGIKRMELTKLRSMLQLRHMTQQKKRAIQQEWQRPMRRRKRQEQAPTQVLER